MCQVKTPKVETIVPSVDNTEAIRSANIEAKLRRRRAGAAANILTSATGIPAGSKLGVPGQ